jgi:hypothetical protein
MDKRPDLRLILWHNVSALMRASWGRENLTRLSKEAGLGPGTVSRLKACETHVQTDTLDAIASVFDLHAWQLLVPNIEPGNAPVLQLASPAERKLYKKFLEFKRAMLEDDEEEVAGRLPSTPASRPLED